MKFEYNGNLDEKARIKEVAQDIKSYYNFISDIEAYEVAALEDVISTLTLKEILKMIREISYDMVCYYDETVCSKIYRDDTYSKRNIEQACRLQRLLSSACDLFGQSIIEHREFEEDYLQKWTDGGYLQNRVVELENKVKELEEKIYDRANEYS